jgi:hypothetical protein
MPPIARFYGSKTSELAHSVDVLACLCHQPSRPRAPFNRSFRPFARCRRPDCERGSEAAKLRPFGQSGVRLEVPILVNAQPGFLVGCKATHRLKAARINSLHAIRPQVDHDDFVSRHGESVWHLRCAVQPHLGARGTPGQRSGSDAGSPPDRSAGTLFDVKLTRLGGAVQAFTGGS